MSEKRFFKLFKRGMAVALAMSLITGLVPVGIISRNHKVKKAKAAALTFQVGEGSASAPVFNSDNFPTFDMDNGNVNYYFGDDGNAFYGVGYGFACDSNIKRGFTDDTTWELVSSNECIGKVTGQTDWCYNQTNGQKVLDYTASFIKYFLAADQVAMKTENVSIDNPYWDSSYNGTGSGSISAKLWPISAMQLHASDYNFSHQTNDHINNLAKKIYDNLNKTWCNSVWTRSYFGYEDYGYPMVGALSKNNAGDVAICEKNGNYQSNILAAFALDLTKVLIPQDAESGTGATGFFSYYKPSNNSHLKFLINAGSEKSSFTVPTILGKKLTNVYNGKTYQFNYSGASTEQLNGGTNYISAIIYDSTGKAVYYGNLSTVESTTDTVMITIPSNLSVGEDYTLALFQEEKCEAYKTDYASEPVYASFTAKDTFSLNYDVSTNGGTSVAPSSITDIEPDTVFDDASGVFDKTAVKPGWEFVGWNTDKDAHEGINTVTMDNDKTLYAIFKKDINTSFTDVDGTEKRVRNDSASIWNRATRAAVTLPEQGTKTGWTSMGWSLSKEPDPSKIISTPSYNISDSTDFYGIYKKTVTVNIDTDGDGVNDSTKDTDIYANSDSPDITQGTITAPSTSLSKEGYEFDGWCEKDGDGTVYQPGEEMTVTGKGDIVPHFKPVTYKVHFDINNGTSGIMTDQILTYDTASNLTSNTFTRTGYTFAGWSDTPDGDIKYTDGQSVKNLSKVKDYTVNLYAVWKINSSGLTVASAGGTWKHNGNSYTAPESFKQDYNTTLSIEELERTGYTFKEWVKTYDETKASGFNGKLEGNVYTFGEKDSAADTITASWNANKYTVEYYDGSTKAGEDTFTYDVSASLKTFLSLGISKTGYDLKGWSESPSGEVKYTDGESIKNLSSVNNAVIKLYAVYEPHKYKITYNGVVGATNINKTEYTVEDTDFKLTEPVKEGFVFLGWTGEGITSPSKDVSIKTSEHKDLEYTAEWKSLISVSVPAQVQVRMSGGTTENTSPVEFVNSSKSDVKVTVSSFAQTAAGDYTLIDRTADEKADWKKLSHKDRTIALYVENTKDSGFKTSGTKVYVNDSNKVLGVISPGEKASPYITCHHTSSITDEETTLSMGSYTIQWTVALN